MPKKLFVVMHYCCEQNEPSKPQKNIIVIYNPYIKELREYAEKHLERPDLDDSNEYDSKGNPVAMKLKVRKSKKNKVHYSDYEATYDDNTFILFTEVKVPYWVR